MNKKGQIVDTEVLFSAGFIILVVMAIGATLLGYKFSLGMDSGGFEVWKLIVIIIAEIIACYFFAARG
jgi:hypothetical protein|tara:strand:- start:2495 stop:2698 length:204 start_codon:yes stop_codon:yes gene_type:complete